MAFKEKINRIARHWISAGLPSRQVMESTADELDRWKQRKSIRGLWPDPCLMLTATLDDGIGQGISLIERFAKVAGLEVRRIGLAQEAGIIVENCIRHRPGILGLTVMQLDSEDDLAQIRAMCPAGTCIIAGGPAFKVDPELGLRHRVDLVAPNVAYFLQYLTNWTPPCREA